MESPSQPHPAALPPQALQASQPVASEQVFLERLQGTRCRRFAARRPVTFRPALEGLEARVVPDALSGFKWPNLAVSASFMPDGTVLGGREQPAGLLRRPLRGGDLAARGGPCPADLGGGHPAELSFRHRQRGVAGHVRPGAGRQPVRRHPPGGVHQREQLGRLRLLPEPDLLCNACGRAASPPPRGTFVAEDEAGLASDRLANDAGTFSASTPRVSRRRC